MTRLATLMAKPVSLLPQRRVVWASSHFGSLKMLISCREVFELARQNYREFLEIPFWRHWRWTVRARRFRHFRSVADPWPQQHMDLDNKFRADFLIHCGCESYPSGLEISMVTNIITPRLYWTGHEPFDPLCFHLSGDQSSVCSDVTMKCELLALVRTQVRSLDFKRNQRWKLCLTACSTHTHTAVISSACLATAARCLKSFADNLSLAITLLGVSWENSS